MRFGLLRLKSPMRGVGCTDLLTGCGKDGEISEFNSGRPGPRSAHAGLAHADGQLMIADPPTAGRRGAARSLINTEVIRGIEKYSQHWQYLIDRYVPRPLRAYARSQAGVVGEQAHCALQSGTCSYRMYHMSKVA